MSEILSMALSGLGLQPGQTYRATVDGHKIELRVLDDDDEPTPELAEQVMLLPWVELRHPTPPVKVKLRQEVTVQTILIHMPTKAIFGISYFLAGKHMTDIPIVSN